MNVCSIYLTTTTARKNKQTNKQTNKKRNKKQNKKQNKKHGNQKSLLVIGSKLKSSIYKYINTVCTKSAGNDSPSWFTIFGSSACQGQYIFSMSFLTCTAPGSSDTNAEELI